MMLLLFIAVILSLECVPPAPLLGRWQGTLQTSLSPLPVSTRLNLYTDGTYSASALPVGYAFFNYHGTFDWNANICSMNYTYMRINELYTQTSFATLLIGTSSADHSHIVGIGYSSDLGNITLTADEF